MRTGEAGRSPRKLAVREYGASALVLGRRRRSANRRKYEFLPPTSNIRLWRIFALRGHERMTASRAIHAPSMPRVKLLLAPPPRMPRLLMAPVERRG